MHPTCLATQDAYPTCFATWTSLQHHIRTAHPPICPDPACNSKTFKSQKGLRAHMKLHEQSETQDAIIGSFDADSDVDEPPHKKRRGRDIGRDWLCGAEGCGKDFKSVSSYIMPALAMYLKISDAEKSVDDAYECHAPRPSRFYLPSRSMREGIRLQTPFAASPWKTSSVRASRIQPRPSERLSG